MSSELLILLIALILLGGGTALIVRLNRGARHAAALDEPIRPEHLEEHLRTLIQQNKQIRAIKLLREQTGMGLKDAKDAIDALAAGRPISHRAYLWLTRSGHTATPALPQADLATRARNLKEAGKTEQAVFLVRGETGWNEQEAIAFVEAL